jgi:hypothetical protein
MSHYLCSESQIRAVSFVILRLNAVWQQAVGDCLSELNSADVCDLMVLTSIDSLWKYEYGSDRAVFPAPANFPSSTLTHYRQKHCLTYYLVTGICSSFEYSKQDTKLRKLDLTTG